MFWVDGVGGKHTKSLSQASFHVLATPVCLVRATNERNEWFISLGQHMQSILVISASYMQFDEALCGFSVHNHCRRMLGEFFEFKLLFSVL